jgi:hypothetical protein
LLGQPDKRGIKRDAPYSCCGCGCCYATRVLLSSRKKLGKKKIAQFRTVTDNVNAGRVTQKVNFKASRGPCYELTKLFLLVVYMTHIQLVHFSLSINNVFYARRRVKILPKQFIKGQIRSLRANPRVLILGTDGRA